MATLRVQQERGRSPRPHIVVRLRDDEGREGVGEASPLPGFSRDDVDACARALASLGPTLALPEVLLRGATAAELVEASNASSLDFAPSARFAFETALLDLCGRRRGVSVARLLGGDEGATADLRVNALLDHGALAELVARGLAAAAEGYSSIKVKLGAIDDAAFDAELAGLRALRARLPLPFEIRLDPNGGWSLEVARKRLDALREIAPAYVEQPVGAEELHLLGPCGAPWAADESLVYPELVDGLLSSAGCAAFVLKPALLGGLLRARALALRAEESGIGVAVTHLRDGPIAMAAACELALSLPRAPLACGLAPHRDLRSFAAAHGDLSVQQLVHTGRLRPSMRSGLGFP